MVPHDDALRHHTHISPSKVPIYHVWAAAPTTERGAMRTNKLCNTHIHAASLSISAFSSLFLHLVLVKERELINVRGTPNSFLMQITFLFGFAAPKCQGRQERQDVTIMPRKWVSDLSGNLAILVVPKNICSYQTLPTHTNTISFQHSPPVYRVTSPSTFLPDTTTTG